MYVVKCVIDSVWVKTFPTVTYTHNKAEAFKFPRQQAAEVAVLFKWKHNKHFIIEEA
jgi:hypothetical protein